MGIVTHFAGGGRPGSGAHGSAVVSPNVKFSAVTTPNRTASFPPKPVIGQGLWYKTEQPRNAPPRPGAASPAVTGASTAPRSNRPGYPNRSTR
jgi:hypothetical protein